MFWITKKIVNIYQKYHTAYFQLIDFEISLKNKTRQAVESQSNFINIFRALTKLQRPQKIMRSLWELTGSNRRPSACKADALNQLS